MIEENVSNQDLTNMSNISASIITKLRRYYETAREQCVSWAKAENLLKRGGRKLRAGRKEKMPERLYSARPICVARLMIFWNL